MTAFDLPLVFSFGLLGSMHCIQMCGPIVLAYSMPLVEGRSGGSRISSILLHVSYNAGRIITYSVLGAAAGTAGHALGLMGRIAGAENMAAIVAGILLIIAGLSLMGVLPGLGIGEIPILGRVRRSARRLLLIPSQRSKFLLGLAMGFLPCGFLYAGLFKAMETGTPLMGAATMLAFGLGTAGSMIAAGLLSTLLTAPMRRWGNAVAAIGVVLLGALLLYRGLSGHGILPRNHGGAHAAHESH